MLEMLTVVGWVLAAPAMPDGWETRPLTVEDLDPYSADELRLLRNEIYARHGYVFKSADLAEHFRQQPWYKPVPSFDPKAPGALTKVESANVDLIKRTEDARRAEAEPEHSEWALTEKEKFTVLDKDGELRAWDGEPLRAVLECRADVHTSSSKKCGCGFSLQIYDDSRHRRVAAESAALPPSAAPKELVPGPPPCDRSLELMVLDLGPGAGQLLGIEYPGPDDWTDPYQYQKRRYYAIERSGSVRMVLEVWYREGQSSYVNDASQGETRVLKLSETKLEVLQSQVSLTPSIKATTSIKEMVYRTPPGEKEKFTKTTKDEVVLFVWSRQERSFIPTVDHK